MPVTTTRYTGSTAPTTYSPHRSSYQSHYSTNITDISYRYNSNHNDTTNRISVSDFSKFYNGNNNSSSSRLSNRFRRISLEKDYLFDKPPPSSSSSTFSLSSSSSRIRSESRDRERFNGGLTGGFRNNNRTSISTLPPSLKRPLSIYSTLNTSSSLSSTTSSSSSSSLSSSPSTVTTTPSTTTTTTTSSSQSQQEISRQLPPTPPRTSQAISNLDFYEKYSPNFYKPNCELLRSRSLTDASTNKKLNDINNNNNTIIDNNINTSSTPSGAAASTTTKNRTESLRNSTLPSISRAYDREGRLINKPLDSDSFTKSLASSSLSDRSSTEKTEGLCGLRNIGNTCFMNSVIQCLSHTKELTRYLRTKTEERSMTKDQRILYEFIRLIKDMWTVSTRSVTPSELKSAVSSKHRMYSGCAQQDAQEFLRFFLDSLHCSLNTGTKGQKFDIDDNLSDERKADLTWEYYSKIENSKIKDLFVGQLKSTLKCTVCGNTSVTFDPFWDLSVPLPPSSSKCKLESCLDLFIKEEVLDGDEMPTCSKCNARRKSTKSFTIQRFPKYLVIHLKRFSETRWSKLSNIVEFPTGERELNMAQYAASSPSSVLYSLYGISNHMGSTAGGHYVALCKHPMTKQWHEFNDNVVNDTSENYLVSSSAYLLFYELVRS